MVAAELFGKLSTVSQTRPLQAGLLGIGEAKPAISTAGGEGAA